MAESLTISTLTNSFDWDELYIGFDPSLLRFGFGVFGIKRTGPSVHLSALTAAWGPVPGQLYGERIRNLSKLIGQVVTFVDDQFGADKTKAIGVEGSYMALRDPKAAATLIMAESAIRATLEFQGANFQVINNSTWKSVVLGKPKQFGLSKFEKEDISRLVGAKYKIKLPNLNERTCSKGPRKGEIIWEHNDAWDALAVAACLAELAMQPQ